MIPSTAGRLNFILKIFQLSFSPISIPFSNTSRIFRNEDTTNFFSAKDFLHEDNPFSPPFRLILRNGSRRMFDGHGKGSLWKIGTAVVAEHIPRNNASNKENSWAAVYELATYKWPLLLPASPVAARHFARPIIIYPAAAVRLFVVATRPRWIRSVVNPPPPLSPSAQDRHGEFNATKRDAAGIYRTWEAREYWTENLKGNSFCSVLRFFLTSSFVQKLVLISS